MDSLILISNLVEAFLWIVGGVILLCVKTTFPAATGRPYRRAKWYLAITFFIAGLSVFIALFAGKFESGRIEFLSIYSLIIFYISITFMLLSFISLYNSQHLTTRTLLWIFCPILSLIFMHGIVAVLWGSPRVYSFDEYLGQVSSSPALIIRTVLFLAVVSGVMAFMFKYFRARKAYNAMLNDYFSGEDEARRSRWIDHFFVFMLCGLVFVIASYLITSEWFDIFYGAVLSSGMVYLVVKFINYQSVFVKITPAMEYADESKNAIMEGPDTAVGVILQQWMWRDDKPYLKGSLSLSDVSRMTGVSKRKLSAHINIKYGMTFNSWINVLRIQEVERMLRSKANGEKTLSEIAYVTGFADLAAMSNAFKKIMGVSPSVFRKTHVAC